MLAAIVMLAFLGTVLFLAQCVVTRCGGGGGGGKSTRGGASKRSGPNVAQRRVRTTPAFVPVRRRLASPTSSQSGTTRSGGIVGVVTPSPKTRALAAPPVVKSGRLTEAEKAAGLARMNALRAQLTALPDSDPLPRAARPLPPLKWDPEAERVAQEWADGCPAGHRPNNRRYGENLAWSTDNDLVRAANLWDGERAHIDKTAIAAQGAGAFSYLLPGSSDIKGANWCRGGASQCGHLTQQLAASTTSVGCARSTTPCGIPGVGGGGGGGNNRVSLIVCNYSPPGNFIGRPVYPAVTR